MLVFNFHKGYAYQFSNFITYKKPKIGVCVVCMHCALEDSSDLLQSAKCKVQRTNI